MSAGATSTLVLAIDTSTRTASVALVRDGDVVARRDVETPAHSDVLLPAIDALVAGASVRAADIDAFAVGAGPGSFTGLRIGMATAKGLAFAAGRPLWAVSSLAALARDAADDGATGLLVPVRDARRGEIYAGFYVADGERTRRTGATMTAVAAERVLAPGDLAAAIAAVRGDRDAVVFGDVPALVTRAAPIVPSAVAVARLALAGDRSDVVDGGAPVYIRPAEAEIKYPDGVPGALRRE
jgi:tRNA threonylcarbamoyladenosine biosynthesis protein TsaB